MLVNLNFFKKVVRPKHPLRFFQAWKSLKGQKSQKCAALQALQCTDNLGVKLVLYIGVTHPWLPPPWPGQIPTDKGASPALHHPYYFPSAQQSKFYHSKSSSAVLSNIMLCYIFKACSSSPNSLEVEQYFILVSFPGVWSLPARCLNNSRQDNPPSINPQPPHRCLFQLLTALYQLSHGHHGSCPSSSRPHHVHHHTVCDSLSPGYSHSESKHRPACQQHCLVIVINVSFIIII